VAGCRHQTGAPRERCACLISRANDWPAGKTAAGRPNTLISMSGFGITWFLFRSRFGPPLRRSVRRRLSGEHGRVGRQRIALGAERAGHAGSNTRGAPDGAIGLGRVVHRRPPSSSSPEQIGLIGGRHPSPVPNWRASQTSQKRKIDTVVQMCWAIATRLPRTLRGPRQQAKGWLGALGSPDPAPATSPDRPLPSSTRAPRRLWRRSRRPWWPSSS
jgi:hypothetical protein